MASGAEAREANHIRAGYNKADSLQNNVAAAAPAVPICAGVTMAEAVAVALVIEAFLFVRNALLTVKSNVRRPGARAPARA